MKEGYVFLGWTGSNGNVPKLDVTITSQTTGDLEYTANWALYGDIDLNDKVDIGDVTSLRSYIAGYEVSTPITLINIIGDVNLDTEIDDVDADIIQNYLTPTVTKLPYDSGAKYTITYDLNDGEIVDDRNIEKYAEISLSYT